MEDELLCGVQLTSNPPSCSIAPEVTRVRPSIRGSVFSLVVLCFLLTNSLTASADSVSVTGTGDLGNDNISVSVTAGTFSAFSVTPGGPSAVGNFALAGVPMTLSWSAVPFFGPGSTEVNVGNQSTDILDGVIFFTASFTIPASALATGTFTTPVDASGGFQAFQDLTLGQPGNITPGPLMATLDFTAVGTATFQLEDLGEGVYIIRSADSVFKGKGTLQIVPEPTSLFLVGTGLAALAVIVRRKQRFLQNGVEELKPGHYVL
jgi:hypothetical protein